MKKTEEQIEKLKESWLKDPCWDIEDTEGFEDHVDELLLFHKEQDAKWERSRIDAGLRRVEKFHASTGILDVDLCEYVSTFEEISNEINRGQDRESLVEIQAAQARATLLMVAQIKRVAECLEEVLASQLSNEALDFATKLHKVD